MKFCTVADAKALTLTAAGYSGIDNLFVTAIDLATEQVGQFINRDLRKKDYTEYFSTPDTLLSSVPFFVKIKGLNVTGGAFVIEWDATGRFNAPNELITSDTYDFEEDAHKITFKGDFVYSPRGLRVKYNAGYDFDGTDTSLLVVPNTIRQATALQAAAFVDRLQQQDLGQTQNMSDAKGVRTVYEKQTGSGLIQSVQSMLRGYRQPLVGRM